MAVLAHEDLILQAQDLEPLPATATRLARLVSDPNADIKEIVETISLDQALTVKVLRAANSASQGASNSIATVDRAVVRIGTGAVLSMAVAAGVRGRMLGALPAYELEEGRLWAHSVAAALAAESMPGLCKVSVPPECFTAALLHDVGKLVLGRFLDSQVREFLRRARLQSGRDDAEAEFEVFDVHHGELGGLIAAHWKLPRSICVGIQYHHDPASCGTEEGLQYVPWFVHLANLVARRLGKGCDDVLPEDAEFELALEFLGMDEMKLEKLLYRTSLRIDQIGERFG
jgi:HD-like signal output (HDOD) protein